MGLEKGRLSFPKEVLSLFFRGFGGVGATPHTMKGHLLYPSLPIEMLVSSKPPRGI